MSSLLKLVDVLQAAADLRGSSFTRVAVGALQATELRSHAEVEIARGIFVRMFLRLSPIATPDRRDSHISRLLDAQDASALLSAATAWHASAADGAGDHRVSAALDIARQHYRDNDAVRLERLADAVGLSPTYLSRLIVRQTGDGLTAHLRRLRIEAAVRHMRVGTLTIGEVAAETGYSTTSVFCREFKRVMGVPPRRYLGQGKAPARGDA